MRRYLAFEHLFSAHRVPTPSFYVVTQPSFDGEETLNRNFHFQSSIRLAPTPGVLPAEWRVIAEFLELLIEDRS
jgi:hypothetical protein